MSSTILLADDSLTIQKVVELTFADTEHSVVALSSGDELLQKLSDVGPDLVICDIIMPGKDGYEVCQEIKSDPATLHIPVILLSGTFEPFDRDRALAAGCSEIITKPFEARKLVDTVEHLLNPEQAATPVEEGAVVPPPVAAAAEPEPPVAATMESPAVEGFGTRLTGADRPPMPELSEEDLGEPEHGLDFTDTGFAEMEAAADQQEELAGELPEEGLDFEFSDEQQAFGDPAIPSLDAAGEELEAEAADAVETEPPPEPFPDQPSELDTAPPPTDAAEPFAEAADTDPMPPEPTPVAAPDEPFAEAVLAEAAPEQPAEMQAAEPAEEAVEDEPPSHTGVDEAPVDTGLEEPAAEAESEPYPPPTGADEMAPSDEQEPQPPAFGAPPSSEVAEQPLPPPQVTAPLPTMPPGIDLPEPEPPAEESARPEPVEVEDEQSKADTAPQPPELAEVVREADTDDDAQLAAAPIGPQLSDEDVDRIARRLLELAGDRIEHIAWEVVPDMAEVVVRRRIRELETDIEN